MMASTWTAGDLSSGKIRKQRCNHYRSRLSNLGLSLYGRVFNLFWPGFLYIPHSCAVLPVAMLLYRSRRGWESGKQTNKKKGKREKENRLHTLSFGIHYIHSNHRAKYYVVTDR
ncbi:uncharacterized protein BO96DRAFT_141894 [Aspergillus niger CBS 101883]|uniref:uncharacterized protein n=1 Tax=Aspergillus lacticoffeatus (strain CBS 101883) TaxID=1450533 RepID=UPI000D7EC0A4|nr:uncharacterized protein BO96DRAFT_141894 [Aspergillus niger CBS 101883]PYH60526.1 hypothetical protein BO96DRAFT_141894 [Aspergillus niger CBS 101883]